MIPVRAAFRLVALRFNGAASRLFTDARGVAAVEFAAVLPVMLAMYLGTVEVSQGVSIDRKVTLLSRALSDLTAQSTEIDETEKNNIFAAASSVIAPYSSSQIGMTLTSVVFDSADPPVAKVGWTERLGPSSYTVTRARCSTLPSTIVPNGIRLANTSVIMAEIKMPYQPTIGYVLTGTITLSETTFMRPRLQTYIKRKLSNGTVYENC